MADKELTIKISGDVNDYKASLNDAKDSTEGFSEALKAVGEIAAFVEIAAQAREAVKAFNEHEVATKSLTLALQNQGLYSDELAMSYRETAEAISEKTGVDADAITAAQASAQALIGQKVITKELTQAVIDFAAAKKMSEAEAFNIVGKAIEGNVTMLKRYGITLDDAVTSTDRMNTITSKFTTLFGGSAEAIANTSGSTKLFDDQVLKLEKSIGEGLAPAFDMITKAATDLLSYLNEHKELTNLIADFIEVALIAGGVVAAIGSITLAVGALSVAAGTLAAAFGVAIGTVALFTGGLAALALVLIEVWRHWEQLSVAGIQMWKTFVDYVTTTASALGTILMGVFTLDLAKIKEGAKQAVDAFVTGIKSSGSIIQHALDEQYGPPSSAALTKAELAVLAAKKHEADLLAAQQKFADDMAQAINQAHHELIQLQDDGASKERIALKKQEIQTLTEMANTKNKSELASLRTHLSEIRGQEEAARLDDIDVTAQFHTELLQKNKIFQSMSATQQADFIAKNRQALQQGLLTERNAVQQAALDQANIQKKANNQFLLDQQKYGTAYAAINEAMHSQVYDGTKSAFADLAQLQQSSNSTLKEIGKIAALANIVIRTAESAMNIYAGFSTIPIIGPELGVIGAAAAVAFGAEQYSKVNAAAQGGVVTGGVPGIDSVPFLLQRQELVSPAQNFEEVIGSVAATRAAASVGGGIGGGSDDLLPVLQDISAKLDRQLGPNVNIQGDALGDPAWIQVLARKLSDALEFQNAKIFGISTGRALI